MKKQSIIITLKRQLLQKLDFNGECLGHLERLLIFSLFTARDDSFWRFKEATGELKWHWGHIYTAVNPLWTVYRINWNLRDQRGETIWFIQCRFYLTEEALFESECLWQASVLSTCSPVDGAVGEYVVPLRGGAEVCYQGQIFVGYTWSTLPSEQFLTPCLPHRSWAEDRFSLVSVRYFNDTGIRWLT